MSRTIFCATCGSRRGGLEQQRRFWSFNETPIVPRSEDVEGRPWQQTNDLIVNVSIYRNGGTSEDCHLCDSCLTVGLRSAKSAIDAALAASDLEGDKDAQIARLTQQLGLIQHLVAAMELLGKSGVPSYAWNHSDFLQETAQRWHDHLRGNNQ